MIDKTNLVDEKQLLRADILYFNDTVDLDIDVQQNELKTAYEGIDRLDLSNLLNEESEKSRNTLFLVTLSTLIFILLDIEQGRFGFLVFKFAEESQTLIAIFLIILTSLCGYYYYINVKVERVAKSIKFELLEQEISKLKKKFTYLEMKLDPNNADVRSATSKTEKAHLERTFYDVQRNYEKLNNFSTEVQGHKEFLEKWPVFILLGCLVFEALAVAVRLSPWFEKLVSVKQ